MANIKELKAKIKSTKGTFKITSAMKLVSAAKLSKARQRIQALRPYATELANTVKTVSALATDYSHEYLEENDGSVEVNTTKEIRTQGDGGWNFVVIF